MNRNVTYNTLLISLSSLFLSSFPFSLIVGNNPYIIITIQLIIQALYFCFLYYLIKRDRCIGIPGRIRKRNYLIFIPLLLVISSNFFYLIFVPNDFYPNFSSLIILRVFLTIFIVLNEEIIFRGYIFNLFQDKSPLLKIVITAGIFALFHFSYFLSSFNPNDLIIVLYSFGIGLILGLLKEYSGSIIPCLVIHLLFNLINQVLFESLATVSNNFLYLIVNISIALIVGLYLIFLYTFKVKKELD